LICFTGALPSEANKQKIYMRHAQSKRKPGNENKKRLEENQCHEELLMTG